MLCKLKQITIKHGRKNLSQCLNSGHNVQVLIENRTNNCKRLQEASENF